MLSMRLVGGLVVLLAVQGWCKPSKSAEEVEYPDDSPTSDYDYHAEDDNVDSVGEPPQILSKNGSFRIRTGSTAYLPCLTKNTETVAVTWSKGREILYVDNLPQTPDPKRIVRLQNNTLMIVNATVNDTSDYYECTILAKPNSITVVHRLLVDPEGTPSTTTPAHPHEAPIEVIPGKRVEVSQGESITLGCNVRKPNTVEMKWYHENKKVGDDVQVHGDRITIRKVNRHHSGRYQCLADDDSQKPPIAAINLVVNYAPEIEVKREVVHSGIGLESDLICIVHAHPEARVMWYKDQKEIIPKKGRTALKRKENNHTLKIMHTTEQDFGVYTCRAMNNIDQASKTITLTGAPSQAIIYGGEMTKDDTGITLKWQLESYSPITEYELKYRREGDEDWKTVEPAVIDAEGNQFVAEYTITELEPGTYEAVLRARNTFGWSVPSDPHTFRGVYPPEQAENTKGAAVSIRPFGAITALSLVLLSCAFTSL
uniref:Venom protein n=1 Tax=Ampulex compressa TaxID=860918 RepID=A0A1W6EWD6_AMPCP|nr:venom protein [Ampulex compressa]